MNKAKILVVDDDDDIRKIIRIYLINAGYEVITASNAKEALNILSEEINLILLDIMMPDMDGLTACMKIREKYNMPIIFLTAKSEVIDKVTGLSVGGDDYITKPFESIELIARIQAHLRRYAPQMENKTNNDISKDIITIEDLTINLKSYTVEKNNKEITLTRTEFNILKLLMENRGIVFSIDNIYEKVWGEKGILNSENTVSVHIKRLREKIEEDVKNPTIIKTVWGVGYKIN